MTPGGARHVNARLTLERRAGWSAKENQLALEVETGLSEALRKRFHDGESVVDALSTSGGPALFV